MVTSSLGSRQEFESRYWYGIEIRKHGLPKYEISKLVVAVAVGLSLATAGLLLGWTMGWLFPVRSIAPA